jgi:hypothetical protein
LQKWSLKRGIELAFFYGQNIIRKAFNRKWDPIAVQGTGGSVFRTSMSRVPRNRTDFLVMEIYIVSLWVDSQWNSVRIISVLYEARKGFTPFDKQPSAKARNNRTTTSPVTTNPFNQF